MRDWVAILIVGFLALALIIAGSLLIIGCDRGVDVPGAGPTVTTSHPELHWPFLLAADRVGDSLQADGLVDPALVLDIELIDGDSFQSNDGMALWGRNRLVFTGHGPRCQIALALRVEVVLVKPSKTSLAHEAAHCAQDFLFRPDPRHEEEPVWGAGGYVERANDALVAEGL